MNTRTVLILILAATLHAPAQPAKKTILSSDLGGRELTFLNKSNEHDLVLIHLAELGKTKGTAEATRALADLLGTTQEKEHAQLTALARTKGVSLSSAQPGTIKRIHSLLDPLGKAAFDKAWMAEVTDVLKASVQNLTNGSTATDADIKKFATAGLSLAEDKLGVVSKVAAR